MEKILLEIIGLSYSQSQSNAYALILGESNGNRKLPIVIGSTEAQSIALAIEKLKPPRPLTHDLFRDFLNQYDILLKEIVINKFSEGIFHASLICELDGEISELDARPSDAIALALRVHCPIYTYEKILVEAGIIIDHSKDDSENDDLDEIFENFSGINPTDNSEYDDDIDVDDVDFDNIEHHNPFDNYTTESLEEKLQECIDEEDYISAAGFRDEINRRKAKKKKD